MCLPRFYDHLIEDDPQSWWGDYFMYVSLRRRKLSTALAHKVTTDQYTEHH